MSSAIVSLALRFFFGNVMDTTVVTANPRRSPSRCAYGRKPNGFGGSPYRVGMTEDRLLVGLDADQRRAVESDAAPLAIVAAAGSGKTTVLTRRIAYRIERGHAEAPTHRGTHLHPRRWWRAAATSAAPRHPRIDRSRHVPQHRPALASRSGDHPQRGDAGPGPRQAPAGSRMPQGAPARARRLPGDGRHRLGQGATDRARGLRAPVTGGTPSGCRTARTIRRSRRRLRAPETKAWRGRLRRPARSQPARDRSRRGVPRPGALAVSPLLRRRGAGPQPAPARPPRSMARRSRRHLPGR